MPIHVLIDELILFMIHSIIIDRIYDVYTFHSAPDAERYVAICHPMNVKTEDKQKLIRAARVISVVWMISVGASVPLAVFHSVSNRSPPIAADKRFTCINDKRTN